MISVIQPPSEFTDVLYPERPTIFLGGPIQGTYNWQADAIDIIRSLAEDKTLLIANPRRDLVHGRLSDAEYAQQVDWETRWLNQAAWFGVILFWLAKETEPQPGRAYAQTSRFELAEWVTKRPDTVVLGIEKGFPGERYIRYRLSRLRQRQLTSFPLRGGVDDRLQDVCAAAVGRLL